MLFPLTIPIAWCHLGRGALGVSEAGAGDAVHLASRISSRAIYSDTFPWLVPIDDGIFASSMQLQRLSNFCSIYPVADATDFVFRHDATFCVLHRRHSQHL